MFCRRKQKDGRWKTKDRHPFQSLKHLSSLPSEFSLLFIHTYFSFRLLNMQALTRSPTLWEEQFWDVRAMSWVILVFQVEWGFWLWKWGMMRWKNGNEVSLGFSLLEWNNSVGPTVLSSLALIYTCKIYRKLWSPLCQWNTRRAPKARRAVYDGHK